MDEETDNKDTVNNSDELQTMKLAEMTIYGKLLSDLLEAVGSPYGIFVDEKVRQLYRDLNTMILELDDEIDEDFKSRYGAYLGLDVDVNLPEEIDQIKAELMDDLFADLVLDRWREAPYADLPIPRLKPEQYDFIESARECIRRVREWKERHIAAIETGFQQPLESVPLKARMRGIDFSFLRNEALRSTLTDYFEEMAAAYEHDLYRTVVVFARAIVEALLVESLGRIEDDAKMDYAERRRKNPKDIEFWNMPTLVEFADKNHVLVSDPVISLCQSLNQYRNTVHVYSQLRNPRRITRDIAELSILTVSIAHDDIAIWTKSLEAGQE